MEHSTMSLTELKNTILAHTKKQFGEILKFQPVVFDRKQGFILWEKNIFYEITFVDSATKEYISLFASLNIEDTKNCYTQLLNRYGCF